MKEKVYSFTSGTADIKVTLNDWAQRASASALVQSGETTVLVTAVKGEKKGGFDFTPLTINYEEKYAASGKIFGSRFMRREGRPSDTATLNGRMIDRSIRPALTGCPYDLQIVITVFSYDQQRDPVLLGLIGSSIAIEFLGIEWMGPVAGVQISKTESGFIINPKEEEKTNAVFNMFASGTKNKINMIELDGIEAQEADVVASCETAQKELTAICAEILTCAETASKEKESFAVADSADLGKKFLSDNGFDLKKILFGQQEGELDVQSIFLVLEEKKEELGDEYDATFIGVQQQIKKTFKEEIFNTKVRPDGRKFDEIRPLQAAVDVLPRVHGTGLFYRGLTHVLSSTTLAGPGEELWIREIEFEGLKRFIHHYNFPPYSTGETGRMGSPGRREIGHGALAEKAIRPMIPEETAFPYTIRVVSDIVSCNGSTSMASVCGTTLSLLDAGVPLKKPVAGISMGLIYDSDTRYELLTDIQGPEDHFGCMDFKVAGTRDGITAIQLDVKIEGLTNEIIKKTLDLAKKARLDILEVMAKAISAPRPHVKEGAPLVEVIHINPDYIGLVIGSGGKTIQSMTAETETQIDIRDDGTVYVTGVKPENINEVKERIKMMTAELTKGDLLEGTVAKIIDVGAIIEFPGGKSALLHISEIADKRVEKVSDYLSVGDVITVLVKEVRPDGKVSVSLKDAKR